MKPSSDPTKVKVGCRVELELISSAGTPERLTVEIVPDKLADYDSGLLGESTPMARSLLGQAAGRTVPYRMGDLTAVRILSISLSQAKPDELAAARRQEAAQKAAQEVGRTNAMVFAASFSGKWGDYDPAGMEHWDEAGQSDAKPPDDKGD